MFHISMGMLTQQLYGAMNRTGGKGERIRDEKGNYKFNAVPTTDWGAPETLDTWRKSWAEMVNKRFAEKGLDCQQPDGTGS